MFTPFDTVLVTVSLPCIYPPPPSPFHVCRVRNNDMFSSFPESMTHAHDHYWIYGGSQPGLGMLITEETNTEGASQHEGRESCLVIKESVPTAHPPSSPGNHHTLHFWCTVASRCKGLCLFLYCSLSVINVVVIINHHHFSHHQLWHNATSLHLPTYICGQTYVDTYAALTASTLSTIYLSLASGFSLNVTDVGYWCHNLHTSLKYH